MKNEITPKQLDNLIKIVAERMEVDPFQITQNVKCRKREVCNARQVVMSILNNNYKLSLYASGAPFGKDHATVLNANRNINNWNVTDKKFAKVFENILNDLKGTGRVKLSLEFWKYAARYSSQDKSLPDPQQVKILQKRIKDLEYRLAAAERQSQLYKRKYDNSLIPSRVLIGE